MLVAIGLILCSCEERVVGQAALPNIIFIMADDLGYGDLGSYGQHFIKTPNLDKLALEGVRFTQCYAGSPVCAPSRSVLMTGLHTGHTTVRGNTGKYGVLGLGGRQGRVPLEAEDVTVAELLQQAGYITGCIGKWGLGEPGTTGEPRKQGFDYFFGFLNQRRAHDYYNEYIWENESKIEIPENNGEKEGVYIHDLFTEKALLFLDQYRDSTFFLYLPFTIPHDQYEIPSVAPYADRSWTEEEKVHAAMVSRLDRDIGRLLEALEKYKLEENTIVFFCSDNGAARRWEGRFNSSGDLRGRKRDLYEGGIRTPMIVRYSNVLEANSVNAMPWYFADVLPTLCGVANIPIENKIDGVNMWPMIQAGTKGDSNRIFYWEFHERGFQQAVRQGDWKLINKGEDMPLELYQVLLDVGEENDLAQDHPEKVAELRLLMQTSRTPSIHWPREGE